MCAAGGGEGALGDPGSVRGPSAMVGPFGVARMSALFLDDGSCNSGLFSNLQLAEVEEEMAAMQRDREARREEAVQARAALWTPGTGLAPNWFEQAVAAHQVLSPEPTATRYRRPQLAVAKGLRARGYQRGL